jgi:hypothetical protein
MHAKFEVDCEVTGFSRSHEMPLEGRGYVRELADNLDRAMDFYSLRIENRKLKEMQLKIKEVVEFAAHSISNQQTLAPKDSTVASLLVAKDRLDEILKVIEENS